MYTYSTDTLDWDSAVAQCALLDGKLITVRNEYEFDVVLGIGYNTAYDLWVGARTYNTSSNWSWISGYNDYLPTNSDW